MKIKFAINKKDLTSLRTDYYCLHIRKNALKKGMKPSFTLTRLCVKYNRKLDARASRRWS